jgi:biopolymer transport protein ExbD
MRFRARRELKQTRIEIIPMIDTMFFLLVFFILAALNVIDLHGLNLNLPTGSPLQQPLPDQKEVKLQVAIDKGGNYTITGKRNPVVIPMNQDIGGALLAEAQFWAGSDVLDFTKVSLVITPDAETPHEFVIKCIDDAKMQQITRFSLR